MGPVCFVVLTLEINSETLEVIDSYLDRAAKSIVRTRKGRTWEAQIDGRMIDISTYPEPEMLLNNEITLGAVCNSQEDYIVLRKVGTELASLLGGMVTEPTK